MLYFGSQLPSYQLRCHVCTKCFHDTVCYLITVCLPTHTCTISAVPVHYTCNLQTSVSLKSGGNRNAKYIEAMDCGLQKWYLLMPVLRCCMCRNGDRPFPDTYKHTCRTDTQNKKGSSLFSIFNLIS